MSTFERSVSIIGEPAPNLDIILSSNYGAYELKSKSGLNEIAYAQCSNNRMFEEWGTTIVRKLYGNCGIAHKLIHSNTLFRTYFVWLDSKYVYHVILLQEIHRIDSTITLAHRLQIEVVAARRTRTTESCEDRAGQTRERSPREQKKRNNTVIQQECHPILCHKLLSSMVFQNWFVSSGSLEFPYTTMYQLPAGAH